MSYIAVNNERMKATANIYLDTRREKENGLYPVKVRVYYNRKTKLFNTGFDIAFEQYEASYNASKPRGENKALKDELTELEVRARQIIDKLQPFTFEGFERLFYGRTVTRQNVFSYYEDYQQRLLKDGQASTAESYQCSQKSIKKYLKHLGRRKTNELAFSDITVDFLKGYERWMLSENKSPSTIGIYLRPLRALYNLAMEEGAAVKNSSPFGKRKYEIPSGRNVKKALDDTDLSLLFHAELSNEPYKEKARDFFFFSFQCSGINMRDIAELKYKDVTDSNISFIRSKTANSTKANQKPIITANTDFSKHIIAKYGNRNTNPESYVFPIFKQGMDSVEKRRATQKFTRSVNQHLKKLAQELGIDSDVSTYWARHSFATRAVRMGASMEEVMENLGHNSVQTTKNYFAGFGNERKTELANSIMDF